MLNGKCVAASLCHCGSSARYLFLLTNIKAHKQTLGVLRGSMTKAWKMCQYYYNVACGAINVKSKVMIKKVLTCLSPVQ